MILNEEIFRDKEIYNQAKKIIEEYLNTSEELSSRVKNNHLRKMTMSLERLFAQVTLAELNTGIDYVLALIDNKPDNDVLYVVRMIIQMMDNGILTNPELQKLLPFRERICNRVSATEVKFILQKYTFEINGTDLLDEGERQLFFSTFDTSSICNTEMQRVAGSFFEVLKQQDEYNAKVKLVRISAFTYYINNFFNSMAPQDITRATIRSCLVSEKRGNGRVLLDFLYHLEEQTEVSQDLQNFLMHREYLNQHNKKANILQLCDVEYPDRFVVRKCEDEKGTAHYEIFYVNVPRESDIFGALENFVKNSSYDGSTFQIFLNEFWDSLDREIYRVEEFSTKTIESIVQHFAPYQNKLYFTYLYSALNNLYITYEVNFLESEGLDPSILQKQGLAEKIACGYKFVRYNPQEDTPECDQWILSFNPDYETTVFDKASNTVFVDFLAIHNDIFRKWCKEFVWKSNQGLKTKLSGIPNITYFFNYIDDLRKKKELSYHCPNPPTDGPLDPREIIAYRTRLMQDKPDPVTMNTNINNVSVMLQYLERCEITPVSGGVLKNLYNRTNRHEKNAIVIPDEHLQGLANLMKIKSDEQIDYALYQAIFYIMCYTKIRVMRIVDLKVDCVRPTAKENQYVVVSATKVSAGEEEEFPIPQNVKKVIDNVLRITKETRANCTDGHLSNYLFLAPHWNAQGCRKITTQNFRNYLQDCCKQLGYPKYSPQNLRDTYMTNASKFVIANNLSEMQQGILTGHKSSSVTETYYLKLSIQEILEAVHGVIIGDVTLAGTVVEDIPDEIKKPENETSHGCGYCKSKECHNFSYLDCMMCKEFVTTPDKIPYFKEQIAIMDKRIEEAQFPHDREDCVNIKRLLLGYVCKMKEMSVETNAD